MVRREQMGDLTKKQARVASAPRPIRSLRSHLVHLSTLQGRAQNQVRTRAYLDTLFLDLLLHPARVVRINDGGFVRRRVGDEVHPVVGSSWTERDPTESQRRQTSSKARDGKLTLNGSDLHGSECGQGAEGQASERGEHERLWGRQGPTFRASRRTNSSETADSFTFWQGTPFSSCTLDVRHFVYER